MLNKKLYLRQNVRRSTWLLVLPFIFLSFVVWLVDSYQPHQRAVHRRALQSQFSGAMASQINKNQPEITRLYAYYEVQQFDTLPRLLEHFGLSEATFRKYNGNSPVISGTLIKIPPVEYPLADKSSTPLSGALLSVTDKFDSVYVRVSGKSPQMVVTVPELAALTGNYGLLSQTGPREWQLNRSLVLQDNIQLNITSKTLDSLKLVSPKNSAICLCADNSQILINGVTITSIDPETNAPDTDSSDTRSFIRARESSRLDILNSDISFLGNGILRNNNQYIQKQGGTYGVSWRINDNTLGKNVVTGWVEGSSFHGNYFGNFSFGASGMVLRKNRYYANERYGLDPHDDSNNALVEDNVFENNGTHGFIVSKRCMNNIIRGNISRNNKLHGFMLHEKSNFNLIENNQAYGNSDNIVIFNSKDNLVRNNTLSNAKLSNVRISNGSTDNFVVSNSISGTGRGVFIYQNVSKTYIAFNTLRNKTTQLSSKDGVNEIYYVKNKSGSNFKNENLQNSLVTNI